VWESVYIAARMDDLPRVQIAADRLQARGHVITARWITEGNSSLSQPEIARMDLEDIRRASWLILDTITAGESGGREVEYGYVLGLTHAAWTDGRHRRVSLVGPTRNVFHSLVEPTEHFETWEALLASLERKERPYVRRETQLGINPGEGPRDPGGVFNWSVEAISPRA
jgi:hypothetical protein